MAESPPVTPYAANTSQLQPLEDMMMTWGTQFAKRVQSTHKKDTVLVYLKRSPHPYVNHMQDRDS